MKKLIIKLNILLFAFTYLTSANAIDLKLLNASISPDPIVAGSTYIISADIFNNNAATVLNPVNAQFVIVSISNFDLSNVPGTASVMGLNGWNCVYDATIPGGETIECDKSFATLSPFPAGVTQPFAVQITTGSAVVNPDSFTLFTSEESGVTGALEEFPSDNFATVTTSPVSISSVAINKVADQLNYVIGDSVVYTVSVENTSPTAAISNLEISDLLPSSYLDLSPANVTVTANTVIGSSVFTCVFGVVADTATCDNIASTSLFNPGDRVDIVITATADAVGAAIPNIASAMDVQAGTSLGSSNTALINITQPSSPPPLIGATSIAVEKNVLQNGVVVSEIDKGSSFQYEVVVRNTGNFAVSSLSIIDTMPQAITVNNIITSAGMTCNNQGQTYNCNYSQNLPTNSSVQVLFDVTDNSDDNSSTLFNSVRVISLNTQESFAEASVDLIGASPNPNPNPDFSYSIEINDDVDPVAQGDNYNYTVTLKNTGSIELNSINIDVLLPQSLQVNSTNAVGVSCAAVSTGLSCNADGGLSLNPGQELEVVVINVVSPDSFGDVFVEARAHTSNTVVLSDGETTTILENIVIPKADLSISVLNTQMVTQGGQTSFDVAIDNLGSPALKPNISIVLSGLIQTVQVDDNEFWDCAVLGINVNCQYKAASMPFEQSSYIHVSLNLSRVSAQSEDIVIVATAESETDDDFIGNNTSTATISVDPTPTEGEILSALQTALAGRGNQQTNKAIENVASYCEVSYFMALEGLCSDLYETALNGDGEAINTVMEQITPNEVIGQSTSVAEIATAQFRNIGSRLLQLRAGGGGGFSSAGLNARYGNANLPIGMLAYLNKSDDESTGIDVNNDFISPWGFFVNGTISMGSRDATGRELGFDFDSYGLTAGIDYRLSAKKVIGVALGYANFDSNVDKQATLSSTGVTLTGYGSFYVNDNFYIDTRISVAKPNFDQSRKINFTLGDVTVSRVANGSTSGNQYSVAMSAGYDFYKNSWNITPNGSFRYIKTNVDGFTETGAGGFDFNYSNQDLESMIWSAGIRLSKAISLKKGVLSPQFDFDYNYESLNDGNDIEARFVSAPLGEIFIIETDSPDRTYGSAGLGFVYISSNGKQAYINYRSILGLQGFSRGTFNLGARFEF